MSDYKKWIEQTDKDAGTGNKFDAGVAEVGKALPYIGGIFSAIQQGAYSWWTQGGTAKYLAKLSQMYNEAKKKNNQLAQQIEKQLQELSNAVNSGQISSSEAVSSKLAQIYNRNKAKYDALQVAYNRVNRNAEDLATNYNAAVNATLQLENTSDMYKHTGEANTAARNIISNFGDNNLSSVETKASDPTGTVNKTLTTTNLNKPTNIKIGGIK